MTTKKNNPIIYGYIRISTMHQSLERQKINILNKYPKAVIIEEVFTGTTLDRKEWNKLINKTIKTGDTIVFDEASRMSRNAEEAITAYEELFNKDINLIFLKECYLNTEVYKTALASLEIKEVGNELADEIIAVLNKYQRKLAREQIKKAFEAAEYEVEMLRVRTSEGIRAADQIKKLQIEQGIQPEKRLQGRQAGEKFISKKSIKCKELIKKHCKTFGGTLSDVDVMKLCKAEAGQCTKVTFYKYKKQIRLENSIR